MRLKLWSALILITVGLLFLASNLGLIKGSGIRSMLATWWPMIPLAVGIGMLLRRGKR